MPTRAFVGSKGLGDCGCWDLIGVGTGPANLSVAALLAKFTAKTALFLERQTDFHWHPGMLLPRSELQVNVLKDLVTPVDPTNPCSFLNFIVESGRFYAHLTADFERVHRMEYDQYLRWVISRLPNVMPGCGVTDIVYDETFRVVAPSVQLRSRGLSIAIGPAPFIPVAAQGFLHPAVIHSSAFATDFESVAAGRAPHRVLIVGGGQSGAEIFQSLLGQPDRFARVDWVTRRNGLPPLDEAHFSNEFFSPQYARYFDSLSSSARSKDFLSKKLLNDGISQHTLGEIYRDLYFLRYLKGCDNKYNIHANTELISLAGSASGGINAQLRNTLDNTAFELAPSIVVLCTGYQYKFPSILENACRGRLDFQNFETDSGFRLIWDGPEDRPIYLLNSGSQNCGVADRDLSLMAWRAASVVNSLLDYAAYQTIPSTPSMFALPEASPSWPNANKLYGHERIAE